MNDGFTYLEIIDRRGAGMALSLYLAGRYAHADEATWRQRIEAGRVLVNGFPADPDGVLRAGMTVSWSRPPWNEPEVPLTYAVLFEDEDLLAVAKPSGLPTMPGGGFLQHCLLSVVRLRYPGVTPVHRLGRGTSGIVLFARSHEALAHLSASWRGHQVEKVYRALVSGQPPETDFTVRTPIGPVPHPILGTIHAADEAGRPSTSHVHVLQRRPDSTLVDVRIESGRPHQIRIHMAACGHPLVGDPLYVAGGGFRENSTALPGDEGYLLHAFRLAFTHPRTGSRMTIECAPPPELRFRQPDRT